MNKTSLPNQAGASYQTPPTNMNRNFCLSICDLRLWLHLGCSDEERSQRQLTSIAIEINLSAPPIGCDTDKLEDTICYYNIVNSIEKKIKDQYFNLIEHVAARVHEITDSSITNCRDLITSVNVVVQKVNAPMENVFGGTKFMYQAPLK